MSDDSRPTVPTSLARATEILSKGHVHGPEQAARFMRVSYNRGELLRLQAIPFSETTLAACMNSHVLVAGYPLSIVDIRDHMPKLFRPDGWYDEEDFARRKHVERTWHLIRKDLVPGSFSKTLSDQQSLLGPGEALPSACTLVYAIMLHYQATGEQLFHHCWARSADIDSVGGSVSVGLFAAHGLGFDGSSRDYCHKHLGISAARIPG